MGESKHKVTEATWPFSIEGTFGWAGSVFCMTMGVLFPRLILLWYVLAAVSLFFIIDAAWRWHLLEKAGYAKLGRMGLIAPVAHATPTDPTYRHRVFIALASIAIMAWLMAYNKEPSPATPTDSAPAQAELVEKITNPPVGKSEITGEQRNNPNRLRVEALELSGEIFEFISRQEKLCPNWNNETCTDQAVAAYDTAYGQRIRKIGGQLILRGAVSRLDVELTCRPTPRPNGLGDCARLIEKAANKIPIAP